MDGFIPRGARYIVSKNGCLLLNAGPKPDGAIPDQEQEILREMGQWLKVNGEAIYGTRPWRVFGEGPTQIPTGQFTDNDVSFTRQDIRFTTKDDKLFAITLGEPLDVVKIRSPVAEKINAVKLLGYNETLSWSQNESGVTIEMPQHEIGKHAFVFEMELNRGP